MDLLQQRPITADMQHMDLLLDDVTDVCIFFAFLFTFHLFHYIELHDLY